MLGHRIALMSGLEQIIGNHTENVTAALKDGSALLTLLQAAG
jgi:hypothetical protein